ncbi:hypothetical protein SBX64_11375 [Vibrio rhizosphaerae]|uniref:Phage protein n=1 Tax=Vibrio rhizosphaerae TaxID=398736 RepID=A0ABU4IUR7_9VIBR|nr:hypothetical protein [Vibrio rhizosphaerae]MDW6093151.1 hypothetical protein [Vibrio rhizosphaerae]
MNSEILQLESPSQLYEQIEASLIQLLGNDIVVKNYDEYRTMTIESLTLLIEFRYGRAGSRNERGQYCHGFHIRIHCLLPRSAERAFLQVLDSIAMIERFIDRNCWGVDIRQIDMPEFLRTEPSGLQYQLDQVIGRAVSWRQNLYLGEPLIQPDEARGGIAWAVNPEHLDDANEYQPLEVKYASGN